MIGRSIEGWSIQPPGRLRLMHLSIHPSIHPSTCLSLGKQKQEVVDMLFFLSFLPLLWLIKQWAF
jgi:hypothetical protein